MNIQQQLMQVKQASSSLANLPETIRQQLLFDLADRLELNSPQIIQANQLDLNQMSETNPLYDRLLLTLPRINNLATDLRKVANLASPLAKNLEQRQLANGLQLTKVSVPLGVVAVIYEARPNVTIDVFSLCFKAANAVVLKGGSDAWNTNHYLVSLIKQSLAKYNLNEDVIYLMPPSREAVHDLLNATGLIDVCIPRGSHGLIKFVRDNAKIPVIETGAGVVHNYIDISADLKMASRIITNAKTRRVSVCNSLDCLLIHQQLLPQLIQLVTNLSAKQVVLYADNNAYNSLLGHYPQDLLNLASEEHFGYEFLDYKLAIKTVTDISQAIKHIQQYSSGHSEAIIAQDQLVITQFIQQIDVAALYVNASTAFTDGGEFGMGAEIGISTQKLHARGPMGLEALTSYKWVVIGQGQIR